MKVWAVVLAAGEGRRMGGDKLTLPYRISTIIRTVVETVSRAPVDGVVVVLGHHANEIRYTLSSVNVQFIGNPTPDEGMLSSVQCGLNALPADADTALIVLGDQPQLRNDTVATLMDAAEMSNKAMFIPTFDGNRGHPMLLRLRIKEDILSLPAGVGLNAWREGHEEDVELVPVDAPAILEDIDTPDDYRRALESEESTQR